MSDMQSVIEYLIEFGQENNVYTSISFMGDTGCTWIFVRFRRGDLCIERMLYYVPVGDKTVENFRHYNPCLPLVFQEMLRALREKEAEE